MASSASNAALLEPTSPVQFLPGCGPARGEMLGRLGVATVRDLIFLFPRSYHDLTAISTIDTLAEGERASIVGVVEEVELHSRGMGHSVVGVLVRQDSLFLQALWFNQPFQQERFRVGQRVLVSGKPKFFSNRWQMTHPEVKTLDGAEPPSGGLLPVYPLTQGLRQGALRKLIRAALDVCAGRIDDVFPKSFREEHDLAPIGWAIEQIHFPATLADVERARRRFVYQELFVMQLALAVRRAEALAAQDAMALPTSGKIDARIRRLFPFELTVGQNRVLEEIMVDLARQQPMNRLLQGDVGSGKTVVAVYAMLVAVAHGAQAALMAPTELVVQQHARTLEQLLAGSQVQVGVLTGSVTGKERERLLAAVAAGEVQVLLGTQALVEAEVKFARLGLVVIDEQHKFGVRERAAFKQSGHPHSLVMTATPIPRTVALSLYGDLDVSTLDERPPGRPNVHTYLPPEADWSKWWEFFRKKLREGRQGYVVTPVVEGDDGALESLEQSFEALANGELEAFRLGLVHGRLNSQRKEAAMEAFRAGQTQVLVATGVIEVGIDIPNATLMTIQGAERFGLAQLHQLRGRISRGSYPGYCCLLVEGTNPTTTRRLSALVESNDGFYLAETDFLLRGPGELVGDKQHGLPALRVADLARDREVLEQARADAQRLLAGDPTLSAAEYQLLRKMVMTRYGRSLALGDVG
jgi:ATP-dependent DNA helicase RecG